MFKFSLCRIGYVHVHTLCWKLLFICLRAAEADRQIEEERRKLHKITQKVYNYLP